MSTDDLNGANFSGRSTERRDFSGLTLRECNFDSASAPGARFTEAIFEDSSAEGADFSHADFSRSALNETQFVRALLRGSVFDLAQGDGVNFRGANLTNVSMCNVSFFGPDFRGADLTGVDFTGAKLKAADFRGAILDNAIWSGASLINAKFDSGQPITEPTQARDVTPSVSITGAIDAAHDLIRKAVAEARLAELGAQLEREPDEFTQVDPTLLLQSLRREMESRGADVTAVLQPFEQALKALQSATGDEPPEEWKEWIEAVMKNPPPAIAAVVSQLKKPK